MVLHGRQLLRHRRDVGDPRPDDLAEDRLDAIPVAHEEQRLGREPRVLQGDGDELVAAHLTEYQKTRNIRRDPRVAVTVLVARKPGQQTPYLAITGTARIVEGGAPALLKKLAKVMLGSDEHFPPPNAPEGLLTRVRIEKVGGLGPWTS